MIYLPKRHLKVYQGDIDDMDKLHELEIEAVSTMCKLIEAGMSLEIS